MKKNLFVSFFTLTLFATPVPPCLDSTNKCTESLSISKHSTFTFYRTHSLSIEHPEIDQIVVVIHGILRNADLYFKSVVNSAVATGNTISHTAVFAPSFKTSKDIHLENELLWGGGNWKDGAASTSPTAEEISSFAVIDLLLKTLIDTSYFPNLKSIILTGHSAGGQFVSRYAVINPIRTKKILLHYVIANPSTYLYLNNMRAIDGKLTPFENPVTDCLDYNDYIYGLEKRFGYAASDSEKTLLKNITSRNITLFIGDRDTETELLDTSCGAMLQGENRYKRGLTYFNYLKSFFPSPLHQLVIATGVEHDGEKMYNSPQGRMLLFSQK